MQNCKYIEWYVLKTFLLRDIEEHSKTPQDVINELDAEEAAEKAATQNISEIQIFNSNLHPEFGNLRTLTIDGEPWFVGKDVAAALGYGTGKSLANAVAKHVAVEDKGVTEMMTPGGKQKMTIINESGLYSLILSSKLEKAKVFKHWVTSEVLPTIRNTGGLYLREESFLEKTVRVFGTPEEPLFLAKDVADWIDHSDVSMMMQKVDDDEKLLQTLFVSGQNRTVWFLTENGLYEVLMLSRKPKAKEFKLILLPVILLVLFVPISS